MVVVATNHNDLRSFGGREVACEPDGGMRTTSELMKYPILLAIDVSDVYWVTPPGRYLAWLSRPGPAE